MVCCCNPQASAWLKLLACVGLSTGCELGSGGGLLGVTILACWGTGLLGGGGLGAGGFGLGAGGFLGAGLGGLILLGLGLGVAAALALKAACCLSCSLACAITADHTLSDINRQRASWSSALAISLNRIVALLSLCLFSKTTPSLVLNFGLFINKNMRINELVKPKTPEQLKLDQLRATRDRATTAVQQERERQKTQRAQKALQLLTKPRAPTAKTRQPIAPIKPIGTIKSI